MAADRQVLLLDLKDEAEAIAAYDAWHAPGAVPPAVIADIRASGIFDMQIFRAGNRLVMLIEKRADTDPYADAARRDATAETQAWEALMDGFQQPVPCAAPGVKWLAATRIFALSEQP